MLIVLDSQSYSNQISWNLKNKNNKNETATFHNIYSSLKGCSHWQFSPKQGQGPGSPWPYVGKWVFKPQEREDCHENENISMDWRYWEILRWFLHWPHLQSSESGCNWYQHPLKHWTGFRLTWLYWTHPTSSQIENTTWLTIFFVFALCALMCSRYYVQQWTCSGSHNLPLPLMVQINPSISLSYLYPSIVCLSILNSP